MSIFRFKEFDVIQKVCPLKVGTDSMLLGSFIATESKTNALDLGAGTGVLSLMIAQKNPKIVIDAVEIDAAVAKECLLNFQNSKWSSNLDCIIADYFEHQFSKKYDLICSNPPYHFEDTLSINEGLNRSKHSIISDYSKFFQLLSQLLAENGDFWMIIPFSTAQKVINLALEQGLFQKEFICIYSKTSKKNIRVILNFSLNKNVEMNKREFCIRNENNTYSKEYILLTKEFHAIDLDPE